jgi:NAD(P)-dependent dehydrogenase (short-subunit alcohol dehydrogenase family)
VSALAGKVAIVTGAARGLGRDYAKFLAADGADVVLADVRGVEAALKDAAGQGGGRCIGIEVDITDRASVEAMMTRTLEAFGRLDILINNAGLWRGMQDVGLERAPDDVWRAAWAVNVDGTLRCYQAAVPLMKAGGWGRVINISSMASIGGGNAYGLTKNAVERMTAGMAREVGGFGITVNCIAPGITAFEGARGALPNAEAIVAANAIPRLGTSRDLYGAIRYFCSDEAAWVTGQTLRVDGGAVAR